MSTQLCFPRNPPRSSNAALFDGACLTLLPRIIAAPTAVRGGGAAVNALLDHPLNTHTHMVRAPPPDDGALDDLHHSHIQWLGQPLLPAERIHICNLTIGSCCAIGGRRGACVRVVSQAQEVTPVTNCSCCARSTAAAASGAQSDAVAPVERRTQTRKPARLETDTIKPSIDLASSARRSDPHSDPDTTPDACSLAAAGRPLQSPKFRVPKVPKRSVLRTRGPLKTFKYI